MKSIALYFIILSFIALLIRVFGQVKSLLSNFKGDIQREEVDASVDALARTNGWSIKSTSLSLY